jgi:hypothetical protein
MPKLGKSCIRSSQSVEKILWNFDKNETDSVISVFHVTKKCSQNNLLFTFSAWKTITKSVAHACCRIGKTAFGERCFLSEFFVLRRVSLSNSIKSYNQVVFWAFRLLRDLVNRLAIRWFQRKGELSQDRFDWAYARSFETWVDGVWKGIGKEQNVMAEQCWFCFKDEYC